MVSTIEIIAFVVVACAFYCVGHKHGFKDGIRSRD